ncbi:MAG: hydantoinase/oxoprolinase family protein [Phycisphaeraceae bacterium]
MTTGPNQPAWRVGVDTGGTFTDLLLADPHGVVRATCKVLSTPDDPGRAVIQGIDRLLDAAVQQGRLSDADRADFQARGTVVHGSTVATNALLEARGAPAALVTTSGFEDLLTLARQDRPELYALSPARQAPPIPRDRVVGVDERLAYNGHVLTTLTRHEVERVIDALAGLDVQAVAVCLLHSYANDAHERTLAEAIRERLPAVHLTVSSELLPELREYERATTCAVNAVVGPTMARYIGNLDDALGRGRLRIMASGGGTLPPRAVIERPVQTVMSGPAGGVIGAWAMAQAANEPRVIGFDMGGTSTDVALCDRGPTRTTETTINGLPIKLPVIDIHTVGAGGGSIAWIDDGGALRVGPESAGADPGPACYGRQGASPKPTTVTDAHAVLGHLRDGRRLGDALSVDRGAAIAAVGAIAKRLDLPVETAAEGILRVADAAMARAIQRVSVQRGHDARAYTLVAFGGAGGLHACRLADLLGMTRVLVPVHGGLLSAYGMLAAPPRYAFSQAVLQTLEHDGEQYANPLEHPAVQHALNQLNERAEQALQDDGVAASDRSLTPALDLRFAGQSYEITVPIDHHATPIDRFLDEHRRLYGYAPTGKPVELVAARIEALGPAPTITPSPPLKPAGSRQRPRGIGPSQLPDQAETIQVHETNQASNWLRLDRTTLTPGEALPGPAVIEEYAATTVAPRGWSITTLDDGQILLENKGRTNA